MLADNLAGKEFKGSIQSLVGFYGPFLSSFLSFLLYLFLHCQCIFVPKDVLLQKENDQIDRRFPPSKTELYFLLNVTKSKILVNADIYFFF